MGPLQKSLHPKRATRIEPAPVDQNWRDEDHEPGFDERWSWYEAINDECPLCGYAADGNCDTPDCPYKNL